MGSNHSLFGNKPGQVVVADLKHRMRGLFNIGAVAGTPTQTTYRDADSLIDEFTTGTTDSPDIVYGLSSPQALMPSITAPYANGAYLRPYLMEITLSVCGPTPWNGGYVAVTDTSGCPLIVVPYTALRDMASISFPNSEIVKPLYLGPNSATGNGANYVVTYNSSTGVLTLGGNGLPTTTLTPPCVIQIVQGTGKGQTSFIASNTASTITLAQPFAIVPDATSVFAIYYTPVTAAGASTVTFVSNAIAANALDNGFNAIIVGGTGVGGVRPFASNTVASAGPPQTTAGTVSYNWNTQPVAGSLICVSTNTESLGALDMACDLLQPAATVGSTLQVVVGSGGTAGSPVRVAGRYRWGP